MPASRSVAQWIIAVLASVWFFPVSCTTATALGTKVLAELDARDAAKGESVHSSIAIVVLPSPAPDQAFGHLLLGNLAAFKERNPAATFIMPATEGRIEIGGHTTVGYKVMESSDGGQTIETRYKDGDRSAWGRYRATRRDVTPLASKLFGSEYMFSALPYALAFAFIAMFGARLLRRRMRN